MALFDWQDIHNVGVERPDNQPKQLSNIANRFHAAVERGEPSAVLTAAFP